MTTYTSAELAVLAEQIPAEAAGRGLLHVQDAEFMKAADVQLSSDTVELDAALAIAIAAQAPFISLKTDKFDAAEVRKALADDDDEGLPAKTLRLVSAASKHNGDVEALWLRWPAQGLIFEWTATTDWRDKLFEKLESSLAAATHEAAEESAQQVSAERAQVDRLEAKLSESEEFRAASVKRRRAIAEVIAATVAEDLVDTWMFRQALSEANSLAHRKAFEYERNLLPQLHELAVELRKRLDWRTATTVIRRREATLLFLAEKAEGYRLGPSIVEPVMTAARAEPVTFI